MILKYEIENKIIDFCPNFKLCLWIEICLNLFKIVKKGAFL